MYKVSKDQLPFIGASYDFVGRDQDSVNISFFLVEAQLGQGPRLHKHDYDEVVYVIAGRSKWVVNELEIEAKPGDVLVLKAGEPHKFAAVGNEMLQQIDIHLNATFETTWLE